MSLQLSRSRYRLSPRTQHTAHGSAVDGLRSVPPTLRRGVAAIRIASLRLLLQIHQYLDRVRVAHDPSVAVRFGPLERDYVGDEGIGRDLGALESLDYLWELVVVPENGLDLEFLQDPVEGAHAHLFLAEADKDELPSLPRVEVCVHKDGSDARALEYQGKAGTLALGEDGAKAFFGASRGVDDNVCSQVHGKSRLTGRWLDRDDTARSGELEEAHESQADHAGPEHERGIAYAEARAAQRVQRGGQGLDEGGLLHADTCGYLKEHRLRVAYQEVVGQSARTLGMKADLLGEGGLAERVLAAHAPIASPAAGQWVHDHACAEGKSRDVRTEGLDEPNALVAHDGARGNGKAVSIVVDIAPADAAVLHPDEGFARSRLGLLPFHKLQPAGLAKNQTAHDAPPAPRYGRQRLRRV